MAIFRCMSPIDIYVKTRGFLALEEIFGDF